MCRQSIKMCLQAVSKFQDINRNSIVAVAKALKL